MTSLERFKQYPGFVYQLGQHFYFLGKWICKPCTDVNVTDCHAMYEICSSAGETTEAALYFQKLRAYSDFALDIPYNRALVQENLGILLEHLASHEQEELKSQLDRFAHDFETFCGPLIN